MNKKAEIIRVYLPPDANTLLSGLADHRLRSRDYVNVVVAGKQPALNYLSMDDAIVQGDARHRSGVGFERRGCRPRPRDGLLRRCANSRRSPQSIFFDSMSPTSASESST